MKLELWKAALCLALLPPAFAGCVHRSYAAKPITTRVVDAETKQPIQNVIVVAFWGLETEHGTAAELMLLETATDRSGTFHFPAWGPRTAPIGELLNDDPAILLFKDGYKSEVVHNPFRGVNIPERIRSFYYDGKDVEMHKFVGTPKDWAMHLEWFTIFINEATEGQCEWRKIPRLITALGRDREELDAAGIGVGNYYDYLVGNEAHQISEGCGSVRKFLREHAR